MYRVGLLLDLVSKLGASLRFSIVSIVCFLVIYVLLISCFEILSCGSSFLFTMMFLLLVFLNMMLDLDG